jgi:hypothetical protein
MLGNLPGKTPEATMASACYQDLKKKDAEKRIFARPLEGHFGLREWANDPEMAHLLLEPKSQNVADDLNADGNADDGVVDDIGVEMLLRKTRESAQNLTTTAAEVVVEPKEDPIVSEEPEEKEEEKKEEEEMQALPTDILPIKKYVPKKRKTVQQPYNSSAMPSYYAELERIAGLKKVEISMRIAGDHLYDGFSRDNTSFLRLGEKDDLVSLDALVNAAAEEHIIHEQERAYLPPTGNLGDDYNNDHLVSNSGKSSELATGNTKLGSNDRNISNNSNNNENLTSLNLEALQKFEGKTDEDILNEFPTLRPEILALKDGRESVPPLVLSNPSKAVVSNDAYKMDIAELVAKQREKELRIALRRAKDAERLLNLRDIANHQQQVEDAVVQLGYLTQQTEQKKRGPKPNNKSKPVKEPKAKGPGRGRPKKIAQTIPAGSSYLDELKYATLHKKARLAPTSSQQYLAVKVDAQDVNEISLRDLENERIIARVTRVGMQNWNSKENKFYSPSIFKEIIDVKQPTNIPAFAFKMSSLDAERERSLTQNAMRRVFNEFAEGCDPVKQSLNELSASLEKLYAQQGTHKNVMYAALVYAVACYRSEYPEDATLALSKAWDIYFAIRKGDKTKERDAADMQKIREDYEKIVREALGV